MATLQVLSRQPQTVKEARDANAVSTVIRVNKVPISPGGAVARMPGAPGASAPLSAVTFNLANAGGAPLVYVIGDPHGMVEGFAQPAAPP